VTALSSPELPALEEQQWPRLEHYCSNTTLKHPTDVTVLQGHYPVAYPTTQLPTYVSAQAGAIGCQTANSVGLAAGRTQCCSHIT